MAFFAVVPLAPQSADAERIFALSAPVVDLELIYEYEDEKVVDRFRSRDDQSETVWARLKLVSNGWLYHPSFLDFVVDLRPQWRQEDATASGGFELDEESSFLGYRIDATLLKEKPYSLRLFSSQTRDELESSLAPSTVTDSRITRAELHLKSWVVPFKLTLQDSRNESEGFFNTRDSTASWRLDADHEAGPSRTLLRAEFIEQDRAINGSSSSVDRFQANLSNSFRPRDNAQLFSTLFGSHTSARETDTEVLTASERLRFTHRPNLVGDYQLRFESQKREDFSSDLVRAVGGVVHELYENLTSSLTLKADDFATSDGDVDVYDADLNFSYRRGLPFGRIRARAGLGYRLEDNAITAETSQVIDERLNLTGTSPSFLSRPNADRLSILVTDSDGAVVYQELFDYVITIVGSSTGIERTPLGGISDGETVLIDYRFVPRQPFETAQGRYGLGVSLDFKRLASFDYQLDRAEEELVAGAQPNDLIDDTRQRIRFDLTWRASTTRLEYEDRATTRTPLTRWRAQQKLDFRPTQGLVVSASFDISETDFEETGERTDSQGIDARVRWRLGRWGVVEIAGFERTVQNRAQNLDDAGLLGRFQWWFGAWRGSILYETLSQDESFVERTRDRDRVLIQVTRRFG